MARSDYIYLVLCGARRDHILGAYTVKREMRHHLLHHPDMQRDDLSAVRMVDGHPGGKTIMNIDEIKEGK